MKSGLITFAVLLAGTAKFFVLAQDASLKSETASAADLDFFEKRVRPLLVQRCFECHSAKAEKLKGGLLLDSREAILTGGDSGPAAVVGDLEKSLIVQAIRFDNENVQMPPAGKLPEVEIAVLTEWVRAECLFRGPVRRKQAAALSTSRKARSIGRSAHSQQTHSVCGTTAHGVSLLRFCNRVLASTTSFLRHKPSMVCRHRPKRIAQRSSGVCRLI